MAWEGEAVESGDNNQPSQPGGQEGHSSPGPNQGPRRWEGEEEPKDEQTQHEDEGSTSGVGSPINNNFEVRVHRDGGKTALPMLASSLCLSNLG